MTLAHPDTSSQSSAQPLTRAAEAVLATTLDDTALYQAVSHLPPAYYDHQDTQEEPGTGKGSDRDLEALADPSTLRGYMDDELEKTYADLLGSFQPMLQELDRLESLVEQSGGACQSLEQAWATFSLKAQSTTRELNALQEKIDEERQAEEGIEGFISHHLLSPEDEERLKGEKVDQGFLDACTRIQTHLERAHDLETTCPTLASEILDQLSALQDPVPKTLSRYIQQQYASWGTLQGGEDVEVNPMMAQAIQALSHSEALYQSNVDEIIKIRRRYMALSYSRDIGEEGRSGPLDLERVRRYAGDRLAWLHQATMSEVEIWRALLSLDTDPRKSHENPTFAPWVDATFEYILKPFQASIKKALRVEGMMAVTGYQMAQTLQYYTQTLTRYLGKDGTIPTMLDSLLGEAFEVFLKTLEVQAEHFFRYMENPSDDLGSPPMVIEAAKQLRAITEAYASSMTVTSPITSGSSGPSGSGEEEDVRRPGFDGVLGRILGPLLQACELSAGTARLNEGRRHVFLHNCLSLLLEHLGQGPGTKSRREALEMEMREHVNGMIQTETRELLKRSGLFPFAVALEDEDDPVRILPSLVVLASLAN
ncbi:oligomeric Golgi complex subunit 6 [Piptocephalis cylindrospora]|uniref:Oligomeric Golgi complex subunit 6 n=1 Tax=Piptocephalis cylindrospora TaxID=1907219 RepID=A0A4P9Y869_9FUNG|nr:oligomeric Golgi complex subunit 6 [Piptocephalis cylindrospora]|eukprot:RKP15215.1 oligomeric Golgi complex subunit 6 [Piptocephalis cylindrospora]